MLESADTTRPASAPADGAARPVGRAAPYSVAIEVPAQRVSSAELADRLGLSEEWILSRTGVRERPMARPDERLSEFAARVGTAALKKAGVEAEEVDLVLVASLTQDELTPSAAPLVAHAIGADRAGAIDVGAACTGFLSAIALAAAQIETGRCRWVVVIGADFMSRITDPDDRSTAAVFADGAGAAVLVGCAEGRIGPVVLGADGTGADHIFAAREHARIRMRGHETFREAVAHLSLATVQAIHAADLGLPEIDLFVYHQANGRILRALATKLGVPAERLVDCIESLGNSSAATLPLGLADAARAGRLKPGARVLVSAFGAGFTWGGGVLEWRGNGDG